MNVRISCHYKPVDLIMAVLFCFQDGDDRSELSSTDTVILNNGFSDNEPDKAFDEESLLSKPAPDSKITKKSTMVIIKSVTGLNSRPGGACFKLLRGRFQVQFKSLTALTASQIMEVTARKLIYSQICFMQTWSQLWRCKEC